MLRNITSGESEQPRWQGTWAAKVCLEMENHSSPRWSTSCLAISPIWPNYCAFLLQNVNQWGKGEVSDQIQIVGLQQCKPDVSNGREVQEDICKPQLVHFIVKQKLTQHYKGIILQKHGKKIAYVLNPHIWYKSNFLLPWDA